MTTPRIIGVDFGAKKSGSTVWATNDNEVLTISKVQKGKDADKALEDFCLRKGPTLVGIDAPLSIPRAFTERTEDDFMYRACDRAVHGMSPMFLGGMTARAATLKRKLVAEGIQVIEVYPALWARQLKLYDLGYKKFLCDIPACQSVIQKITPVRIPELCSWHEVDAVLSYLTGERYLQGKAERFGDPVEGEIFF